MNATGGVVDGLLPLFDRVVRVLLWLAPPRHVFGHHCSVYVVSQFVVLGARHDTRIILAFTEYNRQIVAYRRGASPKAVRQDLLRLQKCPNLTTTGGAAS